MCILDITNQYDKEFLALHGLYSLDTYLQELGLTLCVALRVSLALLIPVTFYTQTLGSRM